MPLRQQRTAAKLAVSLLQSQHEMSEKGKSLQERIKECSELYYSIASGFTALNCSKACMDRCAVLIKECV